MLPGLCTLRCPAVHSTRYTHTHPHTSNPHGACHTHCAHRESTVTCPALLALAISSSPLHEHLTAQLPQPSPLAMASLNTSTNGPNITRSYQNVINTPPPSGGQATSPTYGQWAVFAVAAPLVSAFQQDGGKESVLKVQSTGGTSKQDYGLSINLLGGH